MFLEMKSASFSLRRLKNFWLKFLFNIRKMSLKNLVLGSIRSSSTNLDKSTPKCRDTKIIRGDLSE
jgi:hypothetical protein